MGISYATNTVTVNGNAGYRKGEYFRYQLAVNNGSSALWTNITVAATNQTSVTGNVFVAQSPEAFGYDADGNMTNDGRWLFTWDGENRLVSLQGLAGIPTGAKFKLDFLYDPQGRRIQKLVSTNNGSAYYAQSTNRFLYDGWNLLAIVNPASSPVQSFGWGADLSGTLQGAGGIGGLLEINDTANGAHFAAFDGNGNARGLVRAADGTLAATYEYGPFGEVIRSTGTMAKSNPFRFSSKFQDDEADLLYYGYRYYNSTVGRWLGRDPLGEVRGPNLYSFCEGSPVSRIDPRGDVAVTFDSSAISLTASQKTRLTNDLQSAVSFAVRHLSESLVLKDKFHRLNATDKCKCGAMYLDVTYALEKVYAAIRDIAAEDRNTFTLAYDPTGAMDPQGDTGAYTKPYNPFRQKWIYISSPDSVDAGVLLHELSHLNGAWRDGISIDYRTLFQYTESGYFYEFLYSEDKTMSFGEMVYNTGLPTLRQRYGSLELARCHLEEFLNGTR
jgi:RHS repeat-associated protein